MKINKTKGLLGQEVAGVNQICPILYDWAWDSYIKACANNWMPTEVSMGKDIEQWKSKTILTEDERLVIKRCMGFFAGSESLVANNLLLSIFKFVTSPECRQYISRQNFEEALHNHTVVYVCESLNLDIAEIYEAYNNIPSIKAKDDFLMGITSDLSRNDFSTATIGGKREFMRNLFTYYVICEGIMFFSGFAMLLSFGRQNKIPGIAEQIQYTLRDECFSPDTEVLTPTGWLRLDSLAPGQAIAQYHTDGSVDFVAPTRINVHAVTDGLWRFSNQEGHVSLNVTDNHRMVYVKKSGEVGFKAAKDMSYHPYSKMLTAGIKSGGTQMALSPEERFRIAFQADGHLPKGEYRNGNRCGHIRVVLDLKNERKIGRLTEILEECGYAYTRTSVEDQIRFSVDAPISITKDFSWVSLDVKSGSWCQEFIEEISHWDGHIVPGNPRRITWGSIVSANADMVQAICALAGYRTNRTMTEDDRSETYSDYHRVHICRDKNYVRGGCINKERVPYAGDTYCVSVPSGMILVRHNNAVAVCGNSLHIQFGINLINAIRDEYPEIWDAEFEAEIVTHVRKAVDLEIAYAHDVLPNGILGMNAGMFVDYVQFVANRRLEALNIGFRYDNDKNPFPWLSESVDLQKNKNFFETRVTEYATGILVEDW
jgi:ribonucleotide reductase beta subunit family protein with ferritin-like domain